ncbi:MAG: four helix bundle protein [Bacteroidetes bacterium B1(2017)]|nr:MAG: four helix bundle protein [Bacteroidetes bacterium B1(2017)]
MFDFEKLEVYQKAKVYHQKIAVYLSETKLTSSERDQLKRASMSIVLNIAEGSGRFTKPDKRKFYIIARGSVFETVAILGLLLEQATLDKLIYQKFYLQAEELSKMLFALIKSLE